MNYLVTGGSGFIGSHLVEALLEGGAGRVVVLDRWLSRDLAPYQHRSAFRYVQGDVRDSQLLSRVCDRVDIVFHLASILGTSESIQVYDPVDVADTNVLGTLRLLQACRAACVEKVICPSTPDVPWLNPYKITKRACEAFCQMFYQEYGLNVTVLRLTNVYGPRERWFTCNWGAPYNYQKVVPTFVMRALMGEPLRIFGDGDQVAVYVHVKDVVRAMLLAAELDGCEGQIIPVGTEERVSVSELAKLITELVESRSELKFVPMRAGEVKVSIAVDTTIAERVLGFKAEIALLQGLQQDTIPYYRMQVRNLARSMTSSEFPTGTSPDKEKEPYTASEHRHMPCNKEGE